MNVTEVREELHRLIDEVDDIYILNGLYRSLLAEKRQREEYEREQSRSTNTATGNRTRSRR